MEKMFSFTFIMAILSAIVGAGFASGKEIYTFFAKFNFWSIPFVFVCGVLFFCVFFVFAKIGQKIRPKSISDLTSKIFGKAGPVVDVAFVISSFITIASMLAGSDSAMQTVFGQSYNFCYASIGICIVTVLIVSLGLKQIYKATNVLVPIILFAILLVSGIFLFLKPKQSASSIAFSGSAFEMVLSPILYVAMNSFTNIFIIAKSGIYLGKGQTKKASFLSAGILTGMILLTLVCILLGGDDVILADMPMLQLAFSLGNVYGILYSIILLLAIFTTIIVTTFAIVSWLENFVKNKFLCCVLTLFVGFVFSRFGFSTIVDIFYPLEGVFGAIFIVYAAIFYFKSKSKEQIVKKSKVNLSVEQDKNFSKNKKIDNSKDKRI